MSGNERNNELKEMNSVAHLKAFAMNPLANLSIHKEQKLSDREVRRLAAKLKEESAMKNSPSKMSGLKA